MLKSEIQFCIATLNCWALPFIWPIGSLHKKYRIEKLIDALNFSNYNVVTLQEIWSEKDFLKISDSIKSKFPYSHYFHSGFTGSGVCLFSVHPIVSTFLHRYSLNGFPHHVHRGDWFGGKIVGMVELRITEIPSFSKDLKVNVYTTHMHAEYNRKNDIYLPHRISQCYELSQFINHTSQGADFIIVSGDFNIEPTDLGYKLITNMSQLSDAWCSVFNKYSENGATCDRLDNCFTSPSLLKKSSKGKRIDYIMFNSKTVCLKLLECSFCFDVISGPKRMNYSDHIGVSASFIVEPLPNLSSFSEHFQQIEIEKSIIEESLKVLKKGQVRVLLDQRIFYGISIFLLFILFLTINVELNFLFSTISFFIFRLLLSLFFAFSLFYSLIGLTIEMKALKETEFSMRKKIILDSL